MDNLDIVTAIFIFLVVFLIALVVALVAFLIFLEINRPIVTKGKVVNKYHSPAYIWYNYVPLRSGNMTMMIPMYHYNDEDWVLVLEGNDQHGKMSRGELYVSQKTWDEVQVDQHY